MPKGDALKKYKIEQKAETRQKIEEAIQEIKTSKNGKVTVAKVAALSGISRASIYANYKDLIDSFASTNVKGTIKEQRNNIHEKDELIAKLREENRMLRDANQKLMDQVVAIQLLKQDKIG